MTEGAILTGLHLKPFMMDSTLTFVTDIESESTNQTTYTLYEKENVLIGGIGTWDMVYMIIQISAATVGISMNSLTVIALSKHGQGISTAIRILMKHQAFTDAWTCMVAIVAMNQPPMWAVGNVYFDYIICHMWHSQFIYYFGLGVSIYNLVLTAVERYVATVYPLRHKIYITQHIKIFISVSYVIALVSSIPIPVFVHVENDECVDGPGFPISNPVAVLIFHFAYYFIMFYGGPFCLFVILYGCIILLFRKRQLNRDLSKSKTIDNASKQVTKTVIIVSLCFIGFVGVDQIYSLLIITGVLHFELNSSTQKIFAFFYILNLCNNPGVYIITMPIFRDCIKKTILL